MLLKNSRLAFGSGMLSLFLLGGCVSGDDGDGADAGGNFNIETEMKVLDIVEAEGDAAGTIETRSYDYGCEGDEVVKDSSDEVQSYVVSGGNLYLWDEEACSALKLSGSSSTIIGKWTANGTGEAEIPEDHRPEGCDLAGTDEEDEDEDGGAFDSLYQDIKISYDVSQTKVKTSFSGNLCMGSLMAKTYVMGTGGVFSVKSSDCASATIENDYNDKTLKISTKFSNETVKVTFSSSGKSCSYTESMDISSNPPVCPEPDYEDEEDKFTECQRGLDFFKGIEGSLNKTSADPTRAVFKKLRASLRGR